MKQMEKKLQNPIQSKKKILPDFIFDIAVLLALAVSIAYIFSDTEEGNDE